MIEKCIGFKVGDKFFPTIEEAQMEKLEALCGEPSPHSAFFAQTILKHKEAVMDILTTGPKSRPKARKINKPKATKPKIVRHEAEQFELPKVIDHSETGA